MIRRAAAADKQEDRWAEEEFGDAALGDRRRVARLVSLTAQASRRPSGTITATIQGSAEREGAYRWVQNEAIDVDAVARAAHLSCAQRCRAEAMVFVPVDASNVTVVDKQKVKGFGQVGNKRQSEVRGLHVMSAIAVTDMGVPVGMCAQSWWVRKEQPEIKRLRSRPIEEKETFHWLKVLDQTTRVFKEAGGGCRPFFQLDCGGDFLEVLKWAHERDEAITIRAAYNRRLLEPDWGLLWPTLSEMKPLGECEFKIPRGRKRKMRTVTLALRASRVVFSLRKFNRKEYSTAVLGVVHAREVGAPPVGEEPIEWMLITNLNVDSFEQAQFVVYGYSLRWRIEAFHRTWKTSCRIEDTQLRSVHAVKAWATVLASVAMRIERLTHLARENPDQPATVEFTEYEIQAVILLRRPKGYRVGDIPTVGQMVRWIADEGGYVGAKSSGRPGAQTIGRGLHEVETVARALKNAKALA